MYHRPHHPSINLLPDTTNSALGQRKIQIETEFRTFVFFFCAILMQFIILSLYYNFVKAFEGCFCTIYKLLTFVCNNYKYAVSQGRPCTQNECLHTSFATLFMRFLRNLCMDLYINRKTERKIRLNAYFTIKSLFVINKFTYLVFDFLTSLCYSIYWYRIELFVENV